MASAKTNRRRFFQIAGGALLAASGAIAFVRTRGYVVSPERAASLVGLTAWQYVLVQQLARRIAAPDRDDPSIPTPDETDVAGFVDAYVANMPSLLARDLGRAFAYVEHLAPLRSGLATRFTRLAPEEQDRVLSALEASDQSLLRGAFAGIKSLVFMGYYRDPRTWAILRYDGPLVNRPQRGWTP